MQGIIYKITPEQGKSVIDELREDIYELDVRVTRIEDDLVDYVTYDALDSKLAEYVTIDTVQTISAKKSFVTSDDPTALEIGKSSSDNYSLRFNTKQDDSIELSSQGDISFTTNGTSADSYVLSDSGFSYSRNGSRDLGSSENAWRNAYVSGVLSDGVDSIAVGDIADKQSVATNAQAIASLDENKVDKVPGKGLSMNDFTDEFETKLEGIEAGAQVNAVTSVAGKTGAVTLDKSDVGLGNVDNTSDLNKPISTATQSALANKADLIDGKVPSVQLPSYVDDVVEYASLSNFPLEGEQGKIYLALDTGLCYRWSGSEYIQVAGSTSVLMFASQANFPAEGEEGVIYVAEDTNKQFRWNGTAYVELSKEDEIEQVTYQTTTPLTEEQVRKAKEGKLIVYNSSYSCFCWPERIYNDSIIFFHGQSVKAVDGVSVPKDATAVIIEINLNIATRTFSSTISVTSNDVVKDHADNFISSTTTPDASGKQLIRALNLRKTQDMIADVYDATATYAVGDYCIYQNDLYVCNTAISAAEAWNSSHWTKTNLIKANTKVIQKTYGSTLTEDEISAFKQSKLGIIITTGITPQNQGPYFFAYVLGDVLYSNTSTAYTSSGTRRITTSQLQISNNRVYTISDFVNLQVALTFNATVPAGTTTIPLEIIKDGNVYYEIAPQAMTSQDIADAIAAVPDHVLNNNSWATIRAVCEAGKAAEAGWQPGDTKTDVGTDGVTRTFRICDMQGLYGKHVVFEQVGLESTNYQWNPSTNVDGSGAYNNYSISDMRTTHLPAILLKYSSELQSSITNTTYKVATNGNDGTLLELTDKLFLPAEKEILGVFSDPYSRPEETAALTQFQYYETHNTYRYRTKYKPNASSGSPWWQRSPSSGFNNLTCNFDDSGTRSDSRAEYTNYCSVAPFFSF